jgi:hypothetical protein
MKTYRRPNKNQIESFCCSASGSVVEDAVWFLPRITTAGSVRTAREIETWLSDELPTTDHNKVRPKMLVGSSGLSTSFDACRLPIHRSQATTDKFRTLRTSFDHERTISDGRSIRSRVV